MNQKLMQEKAQEAVIHFKNGKKKHGMLMDSQPGDFYYFISNNDYDMFVQNQNRSYIETVPTILIDAIDTHLK